MDLKEIEQPSAPNTYINEMVEIYNEKYLGDDYELRKVQKILGRRIRVFPNDGNFYNN